MCRYAASRRRWMTRTRWVSCCVNCRNRKGCDRRLAASFYARAWDAATLRDLWIVSDGVRVDCFVLAGLKFQQAAIVRVRWDAKHRDSSEISLELLGDIVAKVTEGSVTLQED